MCIDRDRVSEFDVQFDVLVGSTDFRIKRNANIKTFVGFLLKNSQPF